MPSFLIADDMQWKRDFLSALIHKADESMNILLAKTTEEAKQIIDEHDDIAFGFIDYEIPSENGPTVIAYLKTKNSDAHIALVTSSPSEHYRSDALEAGAEKVIISSIEEGELIKEVSELLDSWFMEPA